MMYLYRGVTTRLHNQNAGRLMPKKVEDFKYTFKWGEKGATWGGITWGHSTHNAIAKHQLNQEGFPTSGISTTPHFERAIIYARGKSGYSSGYIYEIDRSLLAHHGVSEYIVADYVRQPSIPEDEEVILVAQDFGALPSSVIVEIISIPATE
jgi:hypothetical protein